MQVLKKSGDDGYSIAAIGDVSLAMPQGGAKNQKAWGGFAKDLRKTGLALAQAKGHYNRRRPPPTSRLFATIATASSRIEATMIRNIVKDLFES
jgi:hypothetical protein